MVAKIDINELRKLHEEGYLYKQIHPTLDLTIWNYSDKTQFESYWNEYTLMCRGLVTDSVGNIILRCMPKFFNLSENKTIIPKEPFEIWEKLDGSLLQVGLYQGQRIITSRGSFTSDHARLAAMLIGDFMPQEGLTY